MKLRNIPASGVSPHKSVSECLGKKELIVVFPPDDVSLEGNVFSAPGEGQVRVLVQSMSQNGIHS